MYNMGHANVRKVNHATGLVDNRYGNVKYDVIKVKGGSCLKLFKCQVERVYVQAAVVRGVKG